HPGGVHRVDRQGRPPGSVAGIGGHRHGRRQGRGGRGREDDVTAAARAAVGLTMARIRDLLSSIGEVFQSKTSSLAGRPGERRTGVDDLNDAFCAARRALQAGRPREAADGLETTLENMSVVMAASWAVVGDARMQLGERRRGEEAYRRAAKELKGTRHVPDADQALAITSALIALDKRKDAVD